MNAALLFDIDNTLTPPRQSLRQPMAEVLRQLRIPFHVAAGSHLELLQEQFFIPLRDFGFDKQFDAFLSNGGIHYRCDYSQGMSIDVISAFDIKDHLGNANYQYLIKVLRDTEQNPAFRLPSTLKVMGETVAYRGSMINFVPIGRAEGENQEYRSNRDRFVEFDSTTGLRQKMLEYLTIELSPLIESRQLTISLGGQTSFDISIAAKDKTNAVWTLLNNGVERLIFIGDALFEGGNDAPIRQIVSNWSFDTPCPLETIQIAGWTNTIEVLNRLGFISKGEK